MLLQFEIDELRTDDKGTAIGLDSLMFSNGK